MDIDVSTRGSVTIVAPKGDIDGQTAPELQGKVLPLIVEGAKILVDLAGVKFMSSSGLRVMLLTYREGTAKGVPIVLSGLGDDVRNSMSATGFLQYFTVCATADEGLAELG
jgi:anti-sigma B factor antagonist